MVLDISRGQKIAHPVTDLLLQEDGSCIVNKNDRGLEQLCHFKHLGANNEYQKGATRRVATKNSGDLRTL